MDNEHSHLRLLFIPMMVVVVVMMGGGGGVRPFVLVEHAQFELEHRQQR